MRFYVFYGIYVYISHVVLFSWILLNLLSGHPALAHMLVFKSNNTLIISPFMRQELLVGLFLTLGIVYLHRFALLKHCKFKDIVIDLVFSTLISLNNIYYLTLDILSLPFEGLAWKPMKKDPFSTISFKQTASNLWPTTTMGLLGLLVSFKEPGPELLISLPLFVSFAFSIPIVYWTAKPLPQKSFI